MKNATEMGSFDMIYVPSFIKIRSVHSEVDCRGLTDTQKTWPSHKLTSIFSK
jgi:hypothetical protein